jgi:low temperature requirement protein LtrA
MKKHTYMVLAIILVLAILLFGTNPRDVTSVVLVAPFVLIFSALFLSAAYFLRVKGFTRRAAWAMATFIAMLPTLLLVLQSIGQLTIRDVATIVALFAIIYFYATRVDSTTGR